MPVVRDRAFVLTAYPFKEKDLIVVLFTQNGGKRRGVAAGARGRRSRFGAALNLMSEIEVSFYEKETRELISLQDADLLHTTLPLAAKLDCPFILSYLADSIDCFFMDGQASSRGYRLVGHVLEALEGGTREGAAYIYFSLWMLLIAGVFPSMESCHVCGGEIRKFDLMKMQPLCLSCAPADARALTPEAIGLIRCCVAMRVDEIPEDYEGKVWRELDRFVTQIRNNYLQYPLKTYRFMATCDKLFIL